MVLKRLADALADGDRVLAVIKGSAINNDGAGKVGYTAPSVAGQAEVIAAAQAVAGVEPGTIGYVEAHGTATSLGDPIEVAALAEAFGDDGGRRGFCALGSVKGNVGHLDAAAGVTGLIKTVLALAHGELPASLHYTSPNPRIDFASSPFYVNAERRPWPAAAGPRRAGVSSFGIGGTNAHVVLEEAPLPVAPTASAGRRWQLLPLAARSETALAAMAARLADHLRGHPELDLADAAYTLQVGRRELDRRRVVLARDREEAGARLDAARRRGGRRWARPRRSLRLSVRLERAAERPSVAFVFSGQGAQYPGMAAEPYREEPVFRQAVDECCALLGPPLGEAVRRWLVAEEGDGAEDDGAEAGETWRAQPALFVCQYALARLWASWGIEPAAVLGHSVGEYAAACLAGVMPLAAALALVALRGRLMQALPPGAMLAVGLPEAELRPRLGGALELAAVNGPRQCVVSGPEPDVAALAAALAAAGLPARRLRTSHAFHSAMIDPMLGEFRRAVERVPLAAPRLPYVSSLAGDWAGDEVAEPDYWVRQARRTVRFGAALDRLLDEPERVLLEVGPRQGLRQLARQAAEGRPAAPAPRVVDGLRARRPAAGADAREETRRDAGGSTGEEEQLLAALGQLWMHGAAVDWSGFHAGERRRRVSLPSYPFERRRYWIEAEIESRADAADLSDGGARRPLGEWFHLPSWRRTLAPPPVRDRSDAAREGAGAQTCLILADDQGLGEALGAALRERGWDVTFAAAGDAWEERGGGKYRMRPGDAGDHARLWEAMAAGPGLPRRVLHLWNVTAGGTGGDRDPEPAPKTAPETALARDLARLASGLDRSFYSLFHLAQNLGRYAPAPAPAAPVELLVVADRLHAVESGDRPEPVKAALLGICRVLAQEQDVRCRSVDIDGDTAAEPRWVERCLAELAQLAAPAVPDRLPAIPTVAWRGPYRCVPGWDEVALAPAADGAAGLRRRGVYLITGGLGGLGLEVAEHLAETVQARLVLVGRSAFPERERWDEWIASRGEEDAVSRKIRRLRALERRGAELLVVAADVADAAQMAAVRERALARFGADGGSGGVDGVFHAAGVAGGGLLATRTAAQAAAVLAPKAQGTLVLARVFADAELLVLFSSLAALVGGIGQADYAAANAFLDGFAAARAADPAARGPRTIAIDWDAWREVGMAAAAELPEELRDWRARQLEEAIEPAEGRAALARIVQAAGGAGPGQIAVSTHSLARRLAAADDLRLSAAVAASAAAASQGAGRPRHPRPSWAPPYTAPASGLEARLAELWQELLGIEPIGRDDDFFDLGGHSLLAIQLASRLRAELGVEIPIHAIVAGSTPARLAGALAATLAAAAPLAAAPPPRPAVGRLVALQPEGPRLPFFCVHPAGGNTFSYLDLVQCLGAEQPLYALQSDGLDTPFVPGLTLERMAASYADAIRQARPTGPYHVGGWSMGGLVAYEVAQQLHAAGEEVGLLVLFDTRADTRPEGFTELPEDEAELLYILYRDDLDLSREHMAALPPGEAVAYVVAQAQKAGQLPADFGVEQAKGLMAVYMRNRRLMWNYTPRPYPGSMVLFQARERRPGEELPLGLRWDGLVRGGLSTHLVPGDHNDLLVPPYVAEVAARLTRLFAEFEAGALAGRS